MPCLTTIYIVIEEVRPDDSDSLHINLPTELTLNPFCLIEPVDVGPNLGNFQAKESDSGRPSEAPYHEPLPIPHLSKMTSGWCCRKVGLARHCPMVCGGVMGTRSAADKAGAVRFQSGKGKKL